MSIQYLNGRRWSSWSREERLFCADLFEHARGNPSGFAQWIKDTAGLDLDTEGEWDLGYEVCFYRDFLWQHGKSARGSYPQKRTFDLCAFGERAMIVIEAKVCEGFTRSQNLDVSKDRDAIMRILKGRISELRMVALASSKYFARFEKHGCHDNLSMFDGRLTWSQVHGRYGVGDDSLFAQADRMYKLPAGTLVGLAAR